MYVDGWRGQQEGRREGGREGRVKKARDGIFRRRRPLPSLPLLLLSLSFPPFLLLGHYFIAVERMNSLMHPGGDHPTRMMLLLLLLMAMLG